ncbi:hypothetical protein B0H10DRAFT_1939488 [Mycena sp. CBHHK59/15]|nr:hypothetical protein B0H10DRAFT_1939488 [Mycena sp. CBHHK59/15]
MDKVNAWKPLTTRPGRVVLAQFSVVLSDRRRLGDSPLSKFCFLNPFRGESTIFFMWTATPERWILGPGNDELECQTWIGSVHTSEFLAVLSRHRSLCARLPMNFAAVRIQHLDATLQRNSMLDRLHEVDILAVACCFGLSASPIRFHNTSRQLDFLSLGMLHLLSSRSDSTAARNAATTTDLVNMTVENCIGFCDSKQFIFAGVEFAQECYCGDFIENSAVSTPISDCNSACTVNTAESCGAANRLNIFWSEAEPPPPPTIPTSIGKWESLGCYRML